MPIAITTRLPRAFGFTAFLALLAACSRNPSSPAPGTTAAAPPVAAPVYYVTEEPPPPPPLTEVVVERPGAGFVYIDGYWGLNGGARVWFSGHWERPPQAHAVWVRPRWERRGRGYVFVQGYWH